MKWKTVMDYMESEVEQGETWKIVRETCVLDSKDRLGFAPLLPLALSGSGHSWPVTEVYFHRALK